MLEWMLWDDQFDALLLVDYFIKCVLCLLLARAMCNSMDKVQLTTRQGLASVVVTSNVTQPWSHGAAPFDANRRLVSWALGGSLWMSLGGVLARSLAGKKTVSHVALIITVISMYTIEYWLIFKELSPGYILTLLEKQCWRNKTIKDLNVRQRMKLKMQRLDKRWNCQRWRRKKKTQWMERFLCFLNK